MSTNEDIMQILWVIQEDVKVTKSTLISVAQENKELKKVRDKIATDLEIYKKKCHELKLKNISMEKNVQFCYKKLIWFLIKREQRTLFCIK